MSPRDALERQLEPLFSDIDIVEPALPEKAPPEVDEVKSSATPPPAPLPRQTPSPSRWQSRLGRLTESLGVVSILGWVLLIGFTLFDHNRPTPASAMGESTPAVAVVAATATPTRSPTPSPTPSPRDQATRRGSGTEVTASSKASATATSTATATPIPSATATPTLRPVEPLHPATATPRGAEALGLDSVPTPVPLVPMPEGAINIVLLGSDQRPHETQWRTDVIIVVSVVPDPPSVSMLSIPRDTWLYIPNWTNQRINLADVHGTLVEYPGSGPGLVKATIEYNFGVHVDYFARVDFAGLMRIVDTLGGIDVLLDCPVEDGFPDDPITEDPSVVTQVSYPEPGVYHIDGKHALWLARSRKTTSEFARSRRQHRILLGIWHKAKQLGLITRLPELWEDVTETVQTDLSLEQVLWLASVGLQMDPSQIHNGFIDGRHLTAWVSPGGANVLLPQTEAIMKDLAPLFNPYPYQAPQGFNQIEVWNGSGHEDWGILAADRLIRGGFQVVEIRQSDSLYEHSVILDFTSSSKGSPLPLLQRLFEAETHRAVDEESDVPFRLVVGADYQPCEWPTPARWVPPTPVPPQDAPTGGDS